MIYKCKISVQFKTLHAVNMTMRDFGFDEQLAPITIYGEITSNRELTEEEIKLAEQTMLTTPMDDFVVLGVTIDGAKH